MSEKSTQACDVDESRRELEELELQTRMESIGQKILVLSGKGGVGKSTVAANLAVSLARAGKKVGLLDVDLHGPSIPKILGLDGQRLGPNATGGLSPIQLSENLSVVSVGMLLESANDAVIWRGPMKYNVIRQFLKDVEWGSLDYLVIDSPPGTGDEPLAVAQMVGRGALAVVVTTPQEVAIADVRRSVSFCKTLDLSVAGIVENMSGLVCPHCGQEVELFKVGGGEKLATEMSVPFLGRIPMDPQIVASGDSGTPFTDSQADSPAAKAFACVIEPILNSQVGGCAEKTCSTCSTCATCSACSQDPQPKETVKMKIAIPTAQGKLCLHFGHCEKFAIVEVDGESKTITSTSFLTPPMHEPGVLPRWLHEQGVNIIIASGMGQRAHGLFAENGIDVVVGAPSETPENVVSAYLAGTLATGDNICDH